MACKVTEDDLIDFHFNRVNAMNRALIEGHLVTCKECLLSFLTVKRDVELTKQADTTPSIKVKNEIYHEFGRYAAARHQIRFHFKPFAFGFAAAAVVVALVFALRQPAMQWPKNSEPSVSESAIGETLDSARTTPDHINLL